MAFSKAFNEFVRLESLGGILLIAAACIAMIAANSPLAPLYASFLDVPVSVQIGSLIIAKPSLLWINDGLMAIFFFLIGLEVKREVLEGELSDLSSVAFPAIGALGGMLIPGLFFAWMNFHDEVAMAGWAIPLATDVAFALGILAMFGTRVPTSLKLFLLTLAIVDDLGAVIIIAIFYTSDLSLTSLAIAFSGLAFAIFMNRRGVLGIVPYALVGVIIWVAVLKSGVHATLAGVALALIIPLKGDATRMSPLKQLEHDLHAPVAYVILPLFAFANAGITFAGMSPSILLHHVTLGVAGGLLIGKFVGVFGFTWVAAKLGIANRPDDATWLQIAGMAALCGIGFTMSLFIAGLAYEQGDYSYFLGDRIGILVGSALSAIAGAAVLAYSLPRSETA
jgi:Na+:H+ antiporter, NhaA family